MHGLFVALGSAAERLTEEHILKLWKEVSPSHLEIFHADREVFVAVFTPKKQQISNTMIWDDNKSYGMVVDGYLIVDEIKSRTPVESHVKIFSEKIREHGLLSSLSSIVSGSFNALALDTKSGIYSVMNDRMASIPLYYSMVEEGCIMSTNPVALASTGLIPKDIDYTACAEWAYIGYTLGDRYFLKDIKLLPPASFIQWNRKTGRGSVERTDLDMTFTLPGDEQPTVSDLAESFSEACQRLSNLEGKTAQLQSAGFDSRLILAAWPEDDDVPCYTYGVPNSLEVMIASEIAGTRGTTFTHVFPGGDQVAGNLDAMFLVNGLIVYPDRFTTCHRIIEDGYDSILDGLGGFLLSGLFYSNDRYFSRTSKYARFFTTLLDQKVSSIGLEAMADALFDDVREVKDDDWFAGYVNNDFSDRLIAERSNILQDIYNELKRLRPQNDSTAILFRNFKLSNRTQHAILQQGVLSRQFVQVYYPFYDVNFLDLLFRIRPERTAHHKLYISLFRKHFPEYGELLYGSSYLPLKKSPMMHKLSKILLSNRIYLPFIDQAARSKSRGTSSWHVWLNESKILRDRAVDILCEGGIGDRNKLHKTMGRIASGEEKGSGKIFHLGSISKWIKLAR